MGAHPLPVSFEDCQLSRPDKVHRAASGVLDNYGTDGLGRGQGVALPMRADVGILRNLWGGGILKPS